MSDTKGKVNLLDTVPVQCGHITTGWEGEYAEEHGTAVWSLIDGKRTVQEIISLLTEHSQNEDDYPSRVTAYIMQLQKDGFVQLRVKS